MSVIRKILKIISVTGIMISLYGCTSKQVINFEKELEVKFTGSNGNSIVTINPKPNGEIQKIKEAAEIEYRRVSQGEPLNPETDRLYALKQGYFYTCSTDADLGTLKNGDKITYACSIPAEFEKEYNIKVEGEKFEVIVSGLEETKNDTENKESESKTDACDIKEKC